MPWRGDADLKDGCRINTDLSGGWYNGKSPVFLVTAASLQSTRSPFYCIRCGGLSVSRSVKKPVFGGGVLFEAGGSNSRGCNLIALGL